MMEYSAEKIYEDFVKRLKNKNILNSFLQNFKISLSFERLFELVWESPERQECLKLPPSNSEINKKGKNESEKFRSEGNRLYKEKKFDKALLAYNYSIMTAPTPDSNNKQLDESLSLGFANRSALLYEMTEYSAAISDIDRAIHYGYPPSKIYKLLERKGKCHLSLQEYQKAEAIFNELSKIQESNKKNIEELIKKCQHLDINKGRDSNIDIQRSKPKESEPVEKIGKFKSLFHTGPLTAPQPPSQVHLKEKEGNFYLTELIQVAYSPYKGRHLLASKDIEPGVVLMTEEAQCSFTHLDTKLRSYCSTCLRRTPAILPCPSCSLVSFCSESCVKIALHEQKFHANECQTLPILVAFKPDASMLLAYRALSTKTIEELQKDASLIQEKFTNTFKREKDGKPSGEPDLTYLKSKNNNALQHDYKSLLYLEGNITSRTPSQLLEVAVYAVLLTQLLLKLPNYQNEDHAHKTQILIGAQAMHLMLNFNCNVHCIKELNIDKDIAINSSLMKEVGYGIYCTLSLVNHGCAPNVLHSTIGNVKYMYSISSIAKGDEIVDSYGERFVSHNLEKRQKNLEENYFFKCRCQACIEEWPMFDDLPINFEIKCLVCQKGVVDDSTSMCKICNTSFSKEFQQNISKKQKRKSKNKHKSLPEIQKIIADGWASYEDAFKEINSFKTSVEVVKKISKFIVLMDKFTILPNKTYIEAQESLMRSYDLMGSQIFVT